MRIGTVAGSITGFSATKFVHQSRKLERDTRHCWLCCSAWLIKLAVQRNNSFAKLLHPVCSSGHGASRTSGNATSVGSSVCCSSRCVILPVGFVPVIYISAGGAVLYCSGNTAGVRVCVRAVLEVKTNRKAQSGLWCARAAV